MLLQVWTNSVGHVNIPNTILNHSKLELGAILSNLIM